MKKDVMYDRDYSFDEQSKEFRKELLYETARREDYKIEKEYLDYNHYEKGSKLKELIQDIDNGQVSTLMVSSMERLSRDPIVALEIIEKVEKNGGQCLFLETKLEKIPNVQKEMISYINELYKRELSKRRKFRTKEKENELPLDKVEQEDFSEDDELEM